MIVIIAGGKGYLVQQTIIVPMDALGKQILTIDIVCGSPLENENSSFGRKTQAPTQHEQKASIVYASIVKHRSSNVDCGRSTLNLVIPAPLLLFPFILLSPWHKPAANV